METETKPLICDVCDHPDDHMRFIQYDKLLGANVIRLCTHCYEYAPNIHWSMPITKEEYLAWELKQSL